MRQSHKGAAMKHHIIASFALITCFTTIFSMMFLVGNLTVSAQETQTKQQPKLVEIVLNKETNEPEALEIAKKLNPSFFDTTSVFAKKQKDAYFSAKFIPLDSKNPKRFIIATTNNNLMYCTGHGCPFYIYENHKNNEWRLSLSLMAYGIFYDQGSNPNRPFNLISQTIAPESKGIKVWMWDIEYYKEVKKK